MASEQLPEQLHIFTVVKEEPTEEVPEISTFCFETITKEEIVLDDQPEFEGAPPTEVSAKHPFQCSECNRTFGNASRRNECVKRHNAVRLGLYKCKYCGKCSSTKQVHMNHLTTHKKRIGQPDTAEDSSDTDDTRAGTPNDINVHERTHKPNTELLQDVEVNVGKQLEQSDRREFLNGTEISLERPFKCFECNRTFKIKAKLNKCIRRHDALKLGLYKCKFCGKCTGTKYEIQRHELIHKKNLELEQFQLSTDSESSSIRSVTVTKEEGSSIQIEKDENGLFKCSECDRSHKRRWMATKCIKRHSARQQGIYECKICNKRTGTLYELRSHDRVHKKPIIRKQTGNFKERPFKCSECSLTFDNQHNLSRCIKRHNAIKLGLFKCEICGKCSGTKQVHAKHIAIHKNEPKKEDCSWRKENNIFKCVECGRTHNMRKFAVRCAKRHMAKRLGLYQCKLCSSRPGSKTDLRRHELTHKKTLQHKQDKSLSIEKKKKEVPTDLETVPKEGEISESNGENSTGSSIQIDKDENGLFKCSECDRSYKERGTANKCIKRHLARQLGLYQCKICNFRPGTRAGLIRHELMHKRKHTSFQIDKDENGLFKCSECDRSYKERWMAIKCMKKHLAKRQGLFQCKICNFHAGTETDLRRHEDRHKQKTLKEPKPARPPSGKLEELTEESEGNSASATKGEQLESVSETPTQQPAETAQADDKLPQEETDEKLSAQKSAGFDCKTCRKRLRNKQSLVRHEIIHRKNNRRREILAEPAIRSNKKGVQTSFCYETVVKEELIIDDDASGDSVEDQQDEDSRKSLPTLFTEY